MRIYVFGHMWTVKAQTSLCILPFHYMADAYSEGPDQTANAQSRSCWSDQDQGLLLSWEDSLTTSLCNGLFPAAECLVNIYTPHFPLIPPHMLEGIYCFLVHPLHFGFEQICLLTFLVITTIFHRNSCRYCKCRPILMCHLPFWSSRLKFNNNILV